MKWLHKTLAPCCFGRACLIANQGFVSEAAAFVVDEALGLDIVPPTNLVMLASPVFNYGQQYENGIRQPLSLSPKIGSFQLFVNGYVDAQTFLDTHAEALADPTSPLARAFQAQFERLVILDYIIRNTDRGTDNWLVRVDDAMSDAPRVAIAAIDNGLAFPFKHPNGCRTYPYAWASLPQAALPFSDTLAAELEPILHDNMKWDSTAAALRDVFELDTSYDDESFEHQMQVMRGQMVNALSALMARLSPLDLLERPPITVEHDIVAGGWTEPQLADAIACFSGW
ncbi:phosphatidylinositol 4-kinase type 2-alpha [Thecamonas trahens ATCC 50062]|uniref:1-phosphatidylinositol 4-kinase n=1 Tax=Thecamonas trahens ATCC 50062 TaxID=461836 RepID=A0A0L0D7V4_THETB|nr:phosphatidylinositol 4-kinase type 2-alpha [Thecamonas trahens ATCC 50062]KNC48467.1 phosphatidylinositol 4-kinase type 2-alpha [Thecamonas trahens ATCC 50062]|eukprot:XP_013758580.1 phosphatidylinositol 4-kinase type 2-alpha [Thecamonas trahens ATCC 50062]